MTASAKPGARIRGHTRRRHKALPRLPRRILARAGPGARLSHRVRPTADAGRLSLGVLIPEEYGGSGLGLGAATADAGGDPSLRLQRRRLPRADVHDGHDAAARQRRSRRRHYLPKIASGELRLQAFGVTEPDQRHRHHAHPHLRQARRRQLRRQRPEDLDQPRRAFRPDGAALPHHAARGRRRSPPTA